MIIVLLANGFEEIEALTPVDMLRRAGLTVKTVGVTGKAPTGAHGITVVCDAVPEEIDLSTVDMAIFPGGMPGADNLDKSEFTDSVIDTLTEKGKRLAAICAAPLVLGKRGLLRGKEATCYPGFEKHLHGAKVVDKGVVTDGNITTAKGMGVALEFARELITLTKGKDKADEICKSIFMEAPTVEATNEDDKDEDVIIYKSLTEFFAARDAELGILPDDSEDDEEETVKAEPTVCKTDYSDYKLPSPEIFALDEKKNDEENDAAAVEYVNTIIEFFESFNISASVKLIERGPRITRIEVVPAKGVKVNQILNLQDDIALMLAAGSVRMIAPIPGKSSIGIEIPNKKSDIVHLRNLLESEDFVNSKSSTCVCLGRDVVGSPVLGDISKMPHMLIGGATGMGKSVFINNILISLLCKAKPNEVKLILIDPKQVEFTMFKDIPHLLVPIISNPYYAAATLTWAIEEMERRYDLLAHHSVRNIDSYNQKVEEGGTPLPKIVIVIDEFGDLMLQVKKEAETSIMRLAQKARAAGIHLIIGTQRPSVNVITGVIKANIPSRAAFKVMSSVDSRTVLDTAGAEKLLDKGDVLYFPAGSSSPIRIQSAYLSDNEVESMADLVKAAAGPDYDEKVTEEIGEIMKKLGHASRPSPRANDLEYSEDELGYLTDSVFRDAVQVAMNVRKVSTSLLQRQLSIGYGKAAKFIDMMENLGIVDEAQGQRPRNVIMSEKDWKAILSLIDE